MKTAAIIVAGGSGSRMRTPTPKQFLELGGKPLLAHAVSRFESCSAIDEVVLVLPRTDFHAYEERMIAWVAGGKSVKMVPGGDRRQDSTAEGLDALGSSFRGWVAVHDGARPFVGEELIRSVIEAAERYGAALAGLPVHETLKEVGRDGCVIGTVDRRRFYRAQTPQCFRYELLREAIDRARQEGFVGTDEAALVERLDVKVYVVLGSDANIKVTTPRDLALAEYYLRVGQ